MKFVTEKVENFVGKEENAGTQHFLLFPQCFEVFYSHRYLELFCKGLRINGKLSE